MNSVAKRLVTTFPNTRFIFSHTPGVTNPADAISRGAAQPTAEEWDEARHIADRIRAAHQGGEATQGVGAADQPHTARQHLPQEAPEG